MKNSILLCLGLISSGHLGSVNFDYNDPIDLNNRINFLLENLESTLELQNTAIALLQTKLVNNQNRQLIPFCLMSAAIAAGLTWLVLEHKSQIINHLNHLG